MPLDDTWTRAASTRPNSYDPETRTVEAIIATTNPVPRHDARGDYLEVFDFAGMDLSEVVGLPVLDSHRTGSIRDTIGRVEAVRHDGNQLIATLRFSSASDVEPVVQRVEDGSARGVSVGYRKAREIEKKTARGREKILTPKLTEVTLTSNPADPSARLRHEEESPMPEQVLETQPSEEAETQRRTDIRGLVRSAGLAPDLADQLIDQNADMTAAKAKVFDALEQRRATPVIRVHSSSEDPSVNRKRMADAMAYQMGGLAELPEPSRDYAGMTMPEMMRDSLERSGTSTRGMSKDEMLHRSAAHGTSDFALATMDAAHLTAMAGYKGAESVLKVLARKQTVTDFKPNHSARFGEMGQLEEIAENGEFTATSFGEEGETMAAKTYGRRINFTRQLIINSQFDVAGHVARAIGEAAGQTEAALLAAQLTANPELRDGTTAFHADRGNVGTPSVPTKDALAEARELMRLRTGTDGMTIIDAPPRFLLVPADLETTAEEILATIQPTKTDDVNPFGGALRLLVEPRLPSGHWYLFADPARLPALRYAYLAGAEGVQIQRRDAWDSLGLSFRGYLDFAAGWVDWRAAHRVATS